MVWQVQDAKNKFSEVIDTSISKGPQIISRRGHNTAVMISFEDYTHYIAPKKELKKTLLSTGFDQLDIERDKTTSGRATNFIL